MQHDDRSEPVLRISTTSLEYLAARWLVDFDGQVFTDEQLLSLRQWLFVGAENCDALLRILRGMRRTLILRRSHLPLMYGERSGPENHAIERLREMRARRGEAVTDDEIRCALGGVIRQLRVCHAWSTTIFSALAEVGAERVTTLEAGESDATFVEVFRISRALGVPPGVFVNDVDRIVK